MDGNDLLLNCAVVVSQGKILGVVPKSYLPNYREFYEMRWFDSAAQLSPTTVYLAGQTVSVDRRMLFKTPSFTFGIEICEDLWSPCPPSTQLALAGAEVIFNLSASNDIVGKDTYLNSLLAQQSARLHSGYVYSSCGYGESTQDLVFGGKAMIYENGHLLREAERFSLEEQLLVGEIDVERMRVERRTNTTLEVGQAIRVISGPLADFDGQISELMPDSGKVKVMLTIFGRDTPVELSLDQIATIV